MSESDFEQPAPVSQYGAHRRAAWLAQLQANSDMASATEMAAHAARRGRLVASKAGLFQHMTPEDLGAAVTERQPVVGSDYGGRPLERNGGAWDTAAITDSPCPPRADLRPGQPAGEMVSPTIRWQRGQ